MDAASLPWSWFRPRQPIAVARAAGRLDVLGGIADYSGATVLELPLALGAVVAAQATGDGQLVARSDGPMVPESAREITLPLEVLSGPPASAPERLHAALAGLDALWAAYVLGPLALLHATDLLPPLNGLRMAVWSDVPAGAGLSSSAALEVAALRALEGLFALDVDPILGATLAQQAEHRVALAPCGIMDQVTSMLGRRDHLLLLRCQPAEVLGHRLLPRDAVVFGVDSGVAHRVSGDQYGRVRAATFMGRKMILASDADALPDGYLCNLPAARFFERYAELLPHELRGKDFLARYGESGDTATRVDPDVLYRVRDCTTHPVLEQENVNAFLVALDRYDASGDLSHLEAAGHAMRRAHDSYGQRCGLGTPETDLIADLVYQAGPARGLFGAKITGGGAGGTVAVLGAGPDAWDAVNEVASTYTRRTGYPARVIAGSGDGAAALPIERMIVDQEGTVHAG